LSQPFALKSTEQNLQLRTVTWETTGTEKSTDFGRNSSCQRKSAV